MSESFRYDVFLSHSSKDKIVVRTIAKRLRDDGLKVWFDEWILKPGDHIQATIEDGLEHSRVLVLCMSANAFGSDWTQLEAGTFRFLDPLNKDRRFIPLRLDDAPIKGSMAQFFCINWFLQKDDHAPEYAKLLEVCRSPMQAAAPGGIDRQAHLAEKVIQVDSITNILGYAFAWDGKHALTTDSNGRVCLWDLHSRRRLREFGIGSIEGEAPSAGLE